MLKINLQTVPENLPVQEQVKRRKENIVHINNLLSVAYQTREMELKQLRNLQVDALLVEASAIEDERERRHVYDWILYVTTGYFAIRFYDQNKRLIKETTDLNDAVEWAFDCLAEDPVHNSHTVSLSHEGKEFTLRQWYNREVQKETQAFA